jgi:hypothetical protein
MGVDLHAAVGCGAECAAWVHTLRAFPADVWEQPLSAFVGGASGLSAADRYRFAVFAHNLARFLYARALGGDCVLGRSVSEEMQYALGTVMRGEVYNPCIEFSSRFDTILDLPVPPELRRGVCMVVELSHIVGMAEMTHRQRQFGYILQPTVVEHLVADDPSYGTLGGMLLLEKRIADRVGDRQFSDKLAPDGYPMSRLFEATLICKTFGNVSNPQWVCTYHRSRHKEIKEILRTFFAFPLYRSC